MAALATEFSFPGMTTNPNAGAQGGTDFRFGNGWVVTARGDPQDLQLLVFASYRGLIQRIPAIISCADNRDDDKVFLDRLELRSLLSTLSSR